MRPAPEEQHALTLGDYMRVVRRRGWIIVLAAALLAAGGVAASLRHPSSYTASADVLLNRQNTGGTSNTSDTTLLSTQAGVAGTPFVAGRVLKAAHVKDLTPQDFLAESTVAAQPGTEILTFTVTNASPTLAVRLATEYARQYMTYRRELDTSALVQARKALEAQIAR